MNKRKLSSVFMLLIVMHWGKGASSQLAVNLLLNNQPPSYLSDWNSGLAGQLVVTYGGGSAATLQVKIATQLQDAGGSIIAVSNNAVARLHTINRGANVIRMDQVLQPENLQFRGGAANSIAASGKLAAGQYFLAVQLLRAADDSSLTQVQQRPFLQVNYQLPFLLFPADKSWLDANTAQTAITFRWSSLLPASREAATYRLQVYEVLQGQTHLQALRSNQPILLVDIRRTTQYIWRPQLPFKDAARHVFTWTVQTLDSRGVPFTSADDNNQGRSEPRVFGVYNKELSGDTAVLNTGSYQW